MTLEDLTLEDWPLEDSFKLVSDFLNTMPCNSQCTEQENDKRASSPSSVSSANICFLHRTSILIEKTQDLKWEALEQQMNEVSVWLAQSDIRREKVLARVLAQMQTINADLQGPIHLKTAIINTPNDAETETMTSPAKDMVADPLSLDVPPFPNARSETNCGTRILPAKAVLEAKTASTPNLEDQLSTDPTDSVSNSHFHGTKSLLLTSQLLPNLLKSSFEPPSAKRGLQDYIQVDQPIFLK